MRRLLLLLFVGLFIASAHAQAPQKSDQDLLQGRWELIHREYLGKELKVAPGAFIYVFQGDNLIVETPRVGKKSTPWKYRLNTAQRPAYINFAVPKNDGTDNTNQYVGIYQIDGDSLKICYKLLIPETSAGAKEANKRPTEFDSKKAFLLELRRIK
jgi:uncharacterized protein (TIGR03067 family)